MKATARTTTPAPSSCAICWRTRSIPVAKEDLDLLATRYLAFLAAAFHESNGRFRNFMSHEHHWLEEIGSEDSHGRALWAAGSGRSRVRTTRATGGLSPHLFERGLPASPRIHLAARMGLHAARNPRIRTRPSGACRKSAASATCWSENCWTCWRECADDGLALV